MHLLPLLLISLGLSACAQEGPLTLEPAFPGLSFDRPVDLQYPADGSDRLFVLEQRGAIRVFENDPQAASADIFLDIKEKVLYGGEQGLLGLAFHPNYAENGFFFLDYTASDPRRTVIARYRVDPSNPRQADPGSEVVLLEVDQPYGNHNGGQIRFGPDGYLYISLGDGGSGGDPQGHGQNTETLLGSILRIDVDNPSAGRPYGIPPDNPFVEGGGRPEIFAYGLRNVWRFSFDGETLWAGDVGQNAYEEIDIIEKGKNYGWNVMEGNHCYQPSTGCRREGLEPPAWEYPHADGRSVTGGFVYRGSRLPDLRGRYIYGDYVTGRIWALDPESRDNVLLAGTNRNISSFGLDRQGELYVLAFDGKIYQLARGA